MPNTTPINAAKLKTVITEQPIVVAPHTPIRAAIARLNAPQAAKPTTSEIETPTQVLHRDLRSRYLIVAETEKLLGILSAQDLLPYAASEQSLAHQTVSQLPMVPPTTVMGDTLPNAQQLWVLLQQNHLRPLLVLDQANNITGFLAYESLSPYLLMQQAAPTPVVLAASSEASPSAPKSQNSSEAPQIADRIAHIHASLDVQTTLATLATEIHTVLGCDRVAIYPSSSPDESTVIAETATDSTRSVLHQPVPEAALRLDWLEPYHQDNCWIVGDLQTVDGSTAQSKQLAQWGIRAQLIAPLMLDGETWGFVLMSEHDRPRQWQLEAIEQVAQLVQEGAIALQQAQAYEQSQTELQGQQKIERQLQRVLEVTANKMGSEFFETSVLQLSEALDVAHVILTERKGPMLRTLAFAMDNVLQPTFEYPIKDTPCEKVMATGEFFCACFVQKHFPKDKDLILLGAESYLGFSMYGAQGETVGHLCVLDREPILRSEWAVRLMRAFAARASAELERQQAIADLQALNQELEAKVAERTADLQRSYQQLQEAQVQLVQSEKMSSLGQLVAGVAHEINNPVSFIYGNLAPCLDYVHDLSHLIELYQAQYPQPTPEIADFIEEADIPYLLEDFPHLIQSMSTGATRIQSIVQSLRTFSYAQQEGCKAIDLHENLDNTLVILQNRLNGRAGNPAIQVVKNYAALPAMECFSGLLNQVFMNLLSNAIDAIEHRQDEDAAYQGCLTITTQVVNPQSVAIAIQDNGVGMPPETQEQVFNPFFTTKPVGVGTGMGLSISYKIVTGDHNGTLTCASVVGEGTTFRVELPQQQASS
ncbi:MAG: GAF domain-containing protein [Spirulina sp. SIO3F2]|nr:GAF domain-containing protein [Spirulina sp. SIO3F2]